MDNSFRYVFIYRIPYLLAHYYLFRAHYHNKCLEINRSRLLRSAILSLRYSRFDVTWFLRDNSNSKARVRFVYVLPEVLHGDFVSEKKISQILTRNVIFFYDYSI